MRISLQNGNVPLSFTWGIISLTGRTISGLGLMPEWMKEKEGKRDFPVANGKERSRRQEMVR